MTITASHKTFLTAFFLLLFFLQDTALLSNPGDTTWITVFNQRKFTQHGNVDTMAVFPTGKQYRKIRLHYLLERYNCPGTPQYCGSWDYTTQIFARPANKDSVEIARVITPYASDWLAQNRKHNYVVEVTDYSSILNDSTEIRFRYDGYSWGFAISVKIEFIEGTPAEEAINVTRVYQGYFPYGNSANPIENYLVPKTYSYTTPTNKVMVKNIISGHGADNTNCSEFCSKFYQLHVNNSMYVQKQLWRADCGSNHIYPQTGTWIYNRANWCPGDVVWPIYHDITPATTANNNYTLDINMQPYTGNGSAGYIYETQLIHYAAPSHQLDLSIEEILAPTSNENFLRFNPRCSNPVIRVKNAGTDSIHSAVFSFGLINGTPLTFTWTGGLAHMEETEIVFPAAAAAISSTVASVFQVSVVTVNGQQDEDQFNDIYSAKTRSVAVVPKDFVIRLMSNNVGSDNVWTLYDENDFPIVTNGPFPNATVTRDTIWNLQPGCYRFEITDASCNGLGWWAAPSAGNGALRFEKATTTGLIMNFPIDFGCEYTRYFIIEPDPVITVGVAVQENISDNIQVFPVPASTQAMIRIDLMQHTAVAYSLVDLNGRVLSHALISIKEGYHQIDLSTIQNGIYFVRITLEDGSSVTKKLVVQK